MGIITQAQYRALETTNLNTLLLDQAMATEDPPTASEKDGLNKKLHAKFFKHMLNVLPTPYSTQDANRV